jgi:hypothetical protein
MQQMRTLKCITGTVSLNLVTIILIDNTIFFAQLLLAILVHCHTSPEPQYHQPVYRQISSSLSLTKQSLIIGAATEADSKTVIRRILPLAINMDSGHWKELQSRAQVGNAPDC